MSLLALALTSGCGGDDDTPLADAAVQPPDATQTPDATPIDTTVCPEDDDFDCAEGGEVRFEYVAVTDTVANDAQITPNVPGTRVTSFFMKNMDPQRYPLPTLETCVNMEAGETWPRAQGTAREYVDVGEDLVITGGAEPLIVNKGPITDPATKDLFFRTHDTWYFKNHAGTTDASIYALPNRAYSVLFPGSSTWPSQLHKDVLWMPQAFNPTSHLDKDFQLVAGTDMTVTWEVATTDKPAGYSEAVLIAFTGSAGPTFACLANNDGSFTIPAATIDSVIARGLNGTFARQVITHGLTELTNDDGVADRRIDWFSVWCYVTTFTIPPPA